MTTKQQREALDYFTTHADDWRSKADGLGCGKVNVIEQRNEYVVQVANQHPGLGRFLDVGCGTGELVCQVAGLGADAVGVDYAPAMIDLASKKAAVAEIARANFTCASIFDFRVQPESYDLIAANGFIEYLSQPQLIDFFDLVADALAPGGSLVVGSRNRLFNLVSMNDFTLQELEAGHVDPLLREALMWTKATGVGDVSRSAHAPLQAPKTEHANTGIEVATRFQYTPLQLIDLLQDRDLKAIDVHPVHIHGVTPSFKATNADIHASIANLLQTCATHST